MSIWKIMFASSFDMSEFVNQHCKPIYIYIACTLQPSEGGLHKKEKQPRQKKNSSNNSTVTSDFASIQPYVCAKEAAK